MSFEIKNKGVTITVDSVNEGISYMGKNLGAMLALNTHETGLNMSIMCLAKGESLTLDDKDGKEIKVTRIIA